MKISVDTVDFDSRRDHWMVALTMTADDDTTSRMLYVFPHDTMEWRAAEYGLDPADTATLLDIVMAEPHLTAEDWATGHQLHDAPDIDTARVDHLARCARAKLRHRLSTRAKGSPAERIRAESPMGPETIAVKRQIVAQARADEARKRRRVALPAPLSDAERAAQLRRKVRMPQQETPPNEALAAALRRFKAGTGAAKFEES
jgi:hypothetical protein